VGRNRWPKQRQLRPVAMGPRGGPGISGERRREAGRCWSNPAGSKFFCGPGFPAGLTREQGTSGEVPREFSPRVGLGASFPAHRPGPIGRRQGCRRQRASERLTQPAGYSPRRQTVRKMTRKRTVCAAITLRHKANSRRETWASAIVFQTVATAEQPRCGTPAATSASGLGPTQRM